MVCCKTLTLLVLILLIMGCATSNYSSGRDFPSKNVSKIEKMVTTTTELVGLFGEPFTKTVTSETEEKWVYLYSNATATARGGLFTMNVNSSGNLKTLDISIKGGVVTDYVFSEGENPYNFNVQ